MTRVLAPALALLLGGCSPPGFLQPYRMDIQQGNYVTQEMVAQLKPGMSKEQVRFIMGTPLLTDIFHAERWDYIYYLDRQRQPKEQRRLGVYFQDGRLARLDGDVTAEPNKEEGRQ